MIKTSDILALLNTIAPFDLAEAWDNSGLQVGNVNWEVKKVMIGLDVSMPLLMAAADWNADLVLTHHPLMIHPEKSIDFNTMPGSAVEIAAKRKMSIISVHTNLDKACDGLNDYFVSKIGILKTKAFPADTSPELRTDEMGGIGRIGVVEPVMPLEKVVRQIKDRLNVNHLRVTGDMALPVRSIAVCTGSGGSLVDAFLKSGADVYITGDMKYHEARQIEASSKGLIDVGHFASEHMAVDLLSDRLNQAAETAGFDIKIKRFKKEKDPFTTV